MGWSHFDGAVPGMANMYFLGISRIFSCSCSINCIFSKVCAVNSINLNFLFLCYDFVSEVIDMLKSTNLKRRDTFIFRVLHLSFRSMCGDKNAPTLL